jgi:hypothetical protein
VPDYRNTLFWDPGLKPFRSTQPTVTFPAGDNRGDYLLRLEGITADGQVVSRKVRITVK